MGLQSADGIAKLAYGYLIEIPEDVSWCVFGDRIKKFQYDSSLFATAARALPDKASLKDDTGVLPEPLAKSARMTLRSILTTTDSDDLTDAEKELQEETEDFENCAFAVTYNLKDDIDQAIVKVLGEDHGLELSVVCASGGYEGDDGHLHPIIVLEASAYTKQVELDYPGTFAVSLGSIIEQPHDLEEFHAKLDKVMTAFGLKAQSTSSKSSEEDQLSSLGWHLIAACAGNPN